MGTIFVATLAMRFSPPSTTTDTMAQIQTPMMKRMVVESAMPSSGLMQTVAIASVSWLACIRAKLPTIPATENTTASGFIRLPRPLVIIYIGPPCTSSRSSLPLYIMASVPSKNFVAIPRSALTHIQKMAPGPPTTRAIATPAMLPSPTVDEMVLISAWNELI